LVEEIEELKKLFNTNDFNIKSIKIINEKSKEVEKEKMFS
jgi:hypothetical protein